MNWLSIILVLVLPMQPAPFLTVLRAEESFPPVTISPSSGWEILTGTIGDVEVVIHSPGIAVRVEIPREFVKGRKENDTSFLSSDISTDYYYYSLIDQSLHYSYVHGAPGYKPDFPPYDPNGPFMAEIRSHDGSGFIEFTPPKHVWIRNLTAPQVAGKYEFLIYVANETCDSTGAPLFPVNPTQTLTITVNSSPFPACISGFIIDPLAQNMPAIKASGVVYALDKAEKPVAGCLVDGNTGFFNVTGLREGEYTLEASAGCWKETGYSYAPTRCPQTVRVSKNGRLALNITLNRGCIIRGEIKYTKPDGTPISSLRHPAFQGTNSVDQFAYPNYTVQAFTDAGEEVASFSARSTGSKSDPFVLRDRAEIKHAAYPPLGTAYSGLPPGRYTLKAWAFGYIQKTPHVVTVTFSSTGSVEIRLVTGGLVAGTISFRHPRSLKPETPRAAEKENFGTLTGTLYGGNILISAWSSTGQLAAVTLIEGSAPNGTTSYADHSSIRFRMVGFSESQNRTFSGVWRQRDYGIAAGTYSIKVHVRGYRQQEPSTVTVSEGLNSSAYVMLVRQGAIRAVVASSAIVSGFSSEVPWAFADVTPHPYLRICEYRDGGAEVGYVETQIGLGTLATRTLPLNFTGRNCAIPEIIFQGCLPSSITDGTYVLRAYTFGYVQRSDVRVTISDGIAVQTRIQVYLGLNLTGAVYMMAGSLPAFLTEDTEVKIEAYDSVGALSAAVMACPNSGAGNFNFTMIGLRGAGHFFYVTPNGHRIKDCGIAAGTYKFKVHDFGAEWRYRVSRQPTLRIETSGSTMYLVANRMSKISGKVWGMTLDNTLVPLSWVLINAGNETSHSKDGKYTLHLPDGSYQVIFSLPGYFSKYQDCTVAGAMKIELDITLEPA